jgi:hypothetical protein
MGWLARIKHLQVCRNVHTGSMKGGKLQFPKNGDLTADDSMQPSTYIKTSTIEEKFHY